MDKEAGTVEKARPYKKDKKRKKGGGGEREKGGKRSPSRATAQGGKAPHWRGGKKLILSFVLNILKIVADLLDDFVLNSFDPINLL